MQNFDFPEAETMETRKETVTGAQWKLKTQEQFFFICYGAFLTGSVAIIALMIAGNYFISCLISQ